MALLSCVLFFNNSTLRNMQLELTWDLISDQEKRMLVDGTDKSSPFYYFVGNENAIKKVKVAAYSALGKKNRQMSELAFSVFGPSSSGKTKLPRTYADVVELPYIEISPKAVKELKDVISHVEPVLENDNIPLKSPNNFYTIPPCIIFLDEVHALSNYMVQGLLKATENQDGILATEDKNFYDCSKVTWFIATTDEGKLFDAFRTRFTPIQLRYLSRKEISRIVYLSYSGLTESACDLVSHYNSRIPRKALEFARYCKMYSEMYPELDIEQVIHNVAKDEGIDEHGMRSEHFQVLCALQNGPVSKSRIGIVLNKKEEEVERYIMPWLLADTEDQSALVTVTNKGYVITDCGLEELSKRGVENEKVSEVE